MQPFKYGPINMVGEWNHPENNSVVFDQARLIGLTHYESNLYALLRVDIIYNYTDKNAHNTFEALNRLQDYKPVLQGIQFFPHLTSTNKSNLSTVIELITSFSCDFTCNGDKDYENVYSETDIKANCLYWLFLKHSPDKNNNDAISVKSYRIYIVLLLYTSN